MTIIESNFLYINIHDGLPLYDKAFQKKFFTLKYPRLMNIHSSSVRHEDINSIAERLNGSTLVRKKIMCGMNTKECVQKIIEAMRIHYNYVRERAGIVKLKRNHVIKLVRENNLLTLIHNSNIYWSST